MVHGVDASKAFLGMIDDNVICFQAKSAAVAARKAASGGGGMPLYIRGSQNVIADVEA